MAVHIKKSSALGALNITPLIDIVFLLLIFFLVTSRFEQEEQSLAIEPPQASEAVPLTAKPQQLFISIDPTGKYMSVVPCSTRQGWKRSSFKSDPNTPMAGRSSFGQTEKLNSRVSPPR